MQGTNLVWRKKQHNAKVNFAFLAMLLEISFTQKIYKNLQESLSAFYGLENQLG